MKPRSTIKRHIAYEVPTTIDSNEDRVATVRAFYDAFAETGYGDQKVEESYDPHTIVSDMIADLLHLARSISADPIEVLDRALMHFTAEESERP